MGLESSSLLVVMLGPPGAGKGTQARMLAEALGVPQVASGDLFRENLSNGTELGRLAQSYMDRGELVPDEVTIRMVEARLEQADAARGAILDGFPRNETQAQALESLLGRMGRGVCCVPYLKVGEAMLLTRLTGRRVCRNCGAVYHIQFNPPKEAGVCDLCQGELYQRADDGEETVRNRLHVYMEQTAPLIEHYRAQGLLVEIDGEQPLEAVQAALLATVRERVPG